MLIKRSEVNEKQMLTYPNQKVIHINKPKYKKDFLSIGNGEWTAASNQLTYNAFKLYLYLAGNANNFDLALSPKALQAEIKMSNGTYTNVVKELKTNRYLVHKQGNIYDFYTTPLPQSDSISHSDTVSTSNELGDNTLLECNSIYQSNVGEINKITKKSNLNKEADATKEKNIEESKKQKSQSSKRQLEDLTDEEITELMQHFKNKTMMYPQMYEHYNLDFGVLDKNLAKKLESIQQQRKVENKKQKNINVAHKYGLSISQADELAQYLTRYTWEQWGEYAENNISCFVDATTKTPQELLSFLRENELATYEKYDEYIPKNRWDGKEKFYGSYEDYLADYINNSEKMTLFAQEYIEKKNKQL